MFENGGVGGAAAAEVPRIGGLEMQRDGEEGEGGGLGSSSGGWLSKLWSLFDFLGPYYNTEPII